jgi:hypothetical protein
MTPHLRREPDEVGLAVHERCYVDRLLRKIQVNESSIRLAGNCTALLVTTASSLRSSSEGV